MNVLAVTEKALGEIQKIRERELGGKVGNDGKTPALRVAVVGGGCSGMSYKMGFDPNGAAADDKVQKMGDITILVDTKSSLFLSGTTLDFTDGFDGQGFVFQNPQAKKTCGCGSSFST